MTNFATCPSTKRRSRAESRARAALLKPACSSRRRMSIKETQRWFAADNNLCGFWRCAWQSSLRPLRRLYAATVTSLAVRTGPVVAVPRRRNPASYLPAIVRSARSRPTSDWPRRMSGPAAARSMPGMTSRSRRRGASSRRLPMLTRLPHRQLYRHGCRRSLASAGSTWRPHSPCRSARHGFYLACGGTESTAEPCRAVSLWTSAAERARELAFPRLHIVTWIDRFRFQIQGRFP